jgi:hypothetical protein
MNKGIKFNLVATPIPQTTENRRRNFSEVTD